MQKKFFKYVINQILLFIFISLLFSFVFSNDSIAQMKVNERNAYNYQFFKYKKKQIGINIIDLLDNLIANTRENKDNNERLPDLVIKPQQDGELYYIKSNTEFTNASGFSKVKDMLEPKNTYNVDTIYNPSTSLIDFIIIEYEKGDLDSYDIFELYNMDGELKDELTIINEIEYRTNTRVNVIISDEIITKEDYETKYLLSNIESNNKELSKETSKSMRAYLIFGVIAMLTVVAVMCGIKRKNKVL